MSHAPADAPREHFVTLFDDSFLPIGLALYESLVAHAGAFRLWVVAIDDAVEKHLAQLALPDLTVIPLRTLETPELLAVKPGRTRAEYCWTLTPFTAQAVFDRDPAARRATYVDADVFFLADPRILLDELDCSGKHVLITEHAYAPEYDRSHDSGRFCVQFLTFDRSDQAHTVMRWWQDRCLEWCFARYEDGKFGDQVYLDQWPSLFGDCVHIAQQVEKTLAPWNVATSPSEARCALTRSSTTSTDCGCCPIGGRGSSSSTTWGLLDWPSMANICRRWPERTPNCKLQASSLRRIRCSPSARAG